MNRRTFFSALAAIVAAPKVLFAKVRPTPEEITRRFAESAEWAAEQQYGPWRDSATTVRQVEAACDVSRCDSLRSFVCRAFDPCTHAGGHADCDEGWCERCGHNAACHVQVTRNVFPCMRPGCEGRVQFDGKRETTCARCGLIHVPALPFGPRTTPSETRHLSTDSRPARAKKKK